MKILNKIKQVSKAYIYSKEVSIRDVAWVDEGQGQYIPIKN